jgi:antitoxin VapB
MVITIDDRQLDEELREAARAAGQTVDQLVIGAVREKLAMSPRKDRGLTESERAEMRRSVQEIVDHIETLPILDDRSADEIMGYNERGMFD